MSLVIKLFLLALFASRALAQGNPQAELEGTILDAVTFEAIDDLIDAGILPDDTEESLSLNTTTLMWASILSGSVDNVAYLLMKIDDVRSLGLGFRIPLELRERALRTTDARITDGDVVALRGLAKAALNPDLASKLVDVFIVAMFGPSFVDRECTDAQPPVFDEEGNPDCNTPQILAFIRMSRIATFEDTEEMQRILAADPNVEVGDLRGAQLFDADVPARSWICAYCYEPEFCSSFATQCPLE